MLRNPAIRGVVDPDGHLNAYAGCLEEVRDLLLRAPHRRRQLGLRLEEVYRGSNECLVLRCLSHTSFLVERRDNVNTFQLAILCGM